jgi:16S rRNA C967 or C1407 C5-methylase (RsmB/RsmF family)
LYDRVLLDAPCSSERHVVQAALEAGGVVSSGSWSKAHCSNLAALQLKVNAIDPILYDMM